jgi:hypothetical protein
MAIYSSNHIIFMVDSNADSSNAYIDFRCNSTSYNGGTGIMRVYETGYIGIGIESSLLGKLDIDQSVSDAAICPLILRQSDISEGFYDVRGTMTAAIATSVLNSEGSFRIEVNGVVKRVPYWADA